MQDDLKAVASPTPSPSPLQPGDIIFECPQCGKSLAIDVRGAGFIVRCPDCRTEIQVPTSEAQSDDEGTRERGSPAEPIALSLEEQVQYLQRQHASDVERLNRITSEMALIQAALDRLVSLIEESRANN
ncbi:MAG: hypothetical protein H3C50_04665 [Kiritimatiellae bacterium]|nr:hypothetical protein [Kiritimatiellia bacterium]MCO5069361.1 hypothetical protein [Kiritimatiellia bacterium]